MNDYEKNLFHGECPFNGKKCNKDIDCIKCKTEQKELNQAKQEWRMNCKMINWDMVVSVLIGIGIYKFIGTLLRIMYMVIFGG